MTSVITLWIVAFFLVVSADILVPIQQKTVASEQLGVAHYDLLGVLEAPKQQHLAGTLHIFVKALKHRHGHHVRGFMFWDACEDLQLWADLKLATPQLLTQWVPEVLVGSSAVNGRNLSFKVFPAVADGRPLTFTGELPFLDSPLHTYYLTVNKWPRRVALSRALRVSHKKQKDSSQLQVFTVVGQLYRLPLQLAARLTNLHVEYHGLMGFNGTLLYAHGGLAGPLAVHPLLQPLSQSGQLAIMNWNFLPDYVERGTYDQVVTHNHAVLSMWGRHVWLFMTDLDELFATLAPSSVQQLLSPGGCLSAGDAITLPQYDTLCGSCLSRQATGDGLSGEAIMWRSKPSGLKPLLKYLLRNKQQLQVKMLINPNFVHQFFVHDALMTPFNGARARELTIHGQECAYVAHLRNLVDNRVTNLTGYEEASDWMWVVKAAQHSA